MNETGKESNIKIDTRISAAPKRPMICSKLFNKTIKKPERANINSLKILNKLNVFFKLYRKIRDNCHQDKRNLKFLNEILG